ncbi:hypothetical protein OOK06_11540 [Streptomyces sp. NBC_00340]|uniref:hypothetical protein n=1 Tax=Streptomyces sp. NBC_00340 TaxID=2975716 RepID=UPI00224D77B7|nr:hypothetical protein [Streptomyces sp. NBC_00340]MCX5132714.1 hypothetical protein [Streptomyces sp. NBC_00340]
MHGHGYAPPPPKRPPTGLLVVLRVIFGALPLLSIGFLAWGSTLRVALVTRRAVDWWIFLGSLLAMGISFAYLSTDHTDDFSSPNGNVGMIILLLNAAACTGYFLFADIRHYSRLAPPGYPAPLHRTPQPGPHYGYPQTAGTGSPYGTPVPHQQPPLPRPPVVPPPPQRPAPVRIDQVRAELDELSDYLRKRDGRTDSGDGR